MSDYFKQVFTGQRVMAILRGMSPKRTVELAEAAWDLGIDLVEVPVQDDEAFASLDAAVRAGGRRGRHVGAGTVTTVRQLDRVVAAGARFAVSPGLDLAILDAATRAGLPFLPGVMTPSEVQAAVGAGARYLKAFPAAMLGPAWFTNMAGPFPGVRFVATGGVDARNASTFLDAGAVAVGVGSALEDEQQIPLLAKLTTEGATPA